MSEPAAPPESLSFEQAMAQLEAIVREMESGQLALEDSLARFEQGNQLAAFCRERLAETERRIEVLVKQDERVEWQPVEEEPTDGQ